VRVVYRGGDGRTVSRPLTREEAQEDEWDRGDRRRAEARVRALEGELWAAGVSFRPFEFGDLWAHNDGAAAAALRQRARELEALR